MSNQNHQCSTFHTTKGSQSVAYAHTRPGQDKSFWEPLEDHLQLVACGDGELFKGARGFASAFGAAQWGELLGLWHDVGKYATGSSFWELD